jgi:very-short-patch-repair endonuclease
MFNRIPLTLPSPTRGEGGGWEQNSDIIFSPWERSSHITLSPCGRGQGEGVIIKHAHYTTTRHYTMKSKLKGLARQLRKSSTKPESILWRHLRDRRCSGFKFRRQQPVAGYVTDFICFEKKLIIEVDGTQHGFDAQRQHDDKRDECLKSQGYTVLRISNDDTRKNLDGVLQTIWSVLNAKVE